MSFLEELAGSFEESIGRLNQRFYGVVTGTGAQRR